MSRRIGIASLIWGVSILLSRVIGIVREAVIGRTLGGGSAADVYWAAFIVPDFLNYLLAGGALSIVFIPIFNGHLARGEREKGWEAFSVIATVLTTALIVLLAALSFLVPRLTMLVAPGFDTAQHAELVHLTRIILPAQLFHIIGGLLAAVLLSQDRHALPAIAPLAYTGGVVAGGLLGRSAEGFAWGVLAGSIVGPFGIPLIGCLRTGLRWRPIWRLRHPDLLTYLLRSLPVMVGWSIVVVDDWFLRREGSSLGTGAVSILTYAKTLMRVPIGVFGFAAGQAAYPTLARLVSEGKPGEMYRTLLSTARVTLVLAVAAQVALTIAGYDIAAVVYGRERLTELQLGHIGSCLALVSLGLGAWAINPLIGRGFYAMGNTWLPAIVGTVVAVIAYPFYRLARVHVGLFGLASVSSIAVTAYVVALAALLARAVNRREPASIPVVPFLTRIAVSLVIGVLAGRLLASTIRVDLSLTGSLLRGGVSGTAGACIFLVACHLAGVAEVRSVAGQIGRRLRHR